MTTCALGPLEVHTITHYRAVHDDGGVAYSLSTRETHRAEERIREWVEQHPGHHLEVWTQTYVIGPSAWERQS